jgi:ABC-type Zn uptake system ZnuABC Zn-binding protein ZnuA
MSTEIIPQTGMRFSIIAPMLLAIRLVLAAVILGITALAVACGEDDDGAASGAVPRIVATTTQAADLARNVAGDDAQVTQLLTANADPHGYELRPRDVEALADADLVVRSGADLDDWLEDAIEQTANDAPVVTLIDAVQTREGGHDEHGEEGHGEEEEHGEEEDGDEHAVDAHWWQDPRNAVLAVREIERALAIVDPPHASAYADRAESYRAEIERLDSVVRACWQRVPQRQRKLVTTHDALGYYADRYGLEVVGTVIPSLSTQGQPSSGEVAELARTIRREGVRVVFPESSVNSKVERAIADATGAEVGGELWADTLGPEGSDGATYVQSITANTRTMIEGVTSGAVSCPG